MPNSPGKSGTTGSKRLAAIDQLLVAGIKQGPVKKSDAINKILEFVPDWTRGDCWQRIRHLRKTTELAGLSEGYARQANGTGQAGLVRRSSSTPWTPADDDKLLNLAGYEPVKKIAQRLGRSERAIRFRLAALGMSAKVTDGWSLRALRQMLRVSPSRLRNLIGKGMLRVRDPRISAVSLAVFCDKIRPSLDSSRAETIAAALADSDDSFSWERIANLLGVPVAQVQIWISAGQLRVVDTFVSDRSFEEFCKKHGDELKKLLIDPPIAKWLVSEYGVADLEASSGTVSRAQKHALVIRTCRCGKRIAGNPYFRHVKACRAVAMAVNRNPVQDSGTQSSDS